MSNFPSGNEPILYPCSGGASVFSTARRQYGLHLSELFSVPPLFSIVLDLPHGPLPRLERVRDDEHGILVHAHFKDQFTQVWQLKGESITSSAELEQKFRWAEARHLTAGERAERQSSARGR